MRCLWSLEIHAKSFSVLGALSFYLGSSTFLLAKEEPVSPTRSTDQEPRWPMGRVNENDDHDPMKPEKERGSITSLILLWRGGGGGDCGGDAGLAQMHVAEASLIRTPTASCPPTLRAATIGCIGGCAAAVTADLDSELIAFSAQSSYSSSSVGLSLLLLHLTPTLWPCVRLISTKVCIVPRRVAWARKREGLRGREGTGRRARPSRMISGVKFAGS